MDLRKAGYVIILALVSQGVLRAETTDERIRKLEELVKNQAEMNKAQAARIDSLERKQARSATDQSVDKALARSNASTAVLAPDLPDVKGTGLYFVGEFLYWTPQQGDITYARTGPRVFTPPFTALANSGHAENVKFGWEPAFRLGLGYKLPYAGWDLKADYTHFSAKATDSVVDPDTSATAAGNAFVIGPALGSAYLIGNSGGVFNQTAERARGTTEVRFDNVDFEIGSRFRVTEAISTRLFFGPRITWLDNSFSAQYHGVDFATTGLGGYAKSKSEFLGYGLRAGVDADWKLKNGFSLFGGAAGSLLTGEFELKRLEIQDDGDGVVANSEIVQNAREKIRRLVPVVQLAAGVNYDRKLLDNLHMRVSLGYEFTNFFNVVNRQHFADDYNPHRVDEIDGNLGFHGLVFRLKFDF